jgi:aryl-alcohol dehydrogenase-like predicted oxidoreductase
VSNLSKICLGTVKLGVPHYGFSSHPQEPNFEAVHFLNQAGALGIHRFDTSPRYGNAEQILGTYIAQSQNTSLISSKIDELSVNDADTPKKMSTSVKKSLSALKIETLDICYLHQNELCILSDAYIQEGLLQLKSDGLISATGASVYSFEECAYAISSGLFDYIQIPLNICDVGFYEHFVKNNKASVKFVARSLFLQGIILNRKQIPIRIKQASEITTYLNQLDQIAKIHAISLLHLCLAFVLQLKQIDHAIIGTTNISNLKSNLFSWQKPLTLDIINNVYELASKEKSWTNPRNW